MKKHFSYLLAPLLLLWACSENNGSEEGTLPEAKPIVLRSALVPKIKQDNTFAFDLFKEVYQTNKTENVFISPLSVSMALSMTLNGAKGETLEEIKNALRISNFSVDEINEYCKILREALLKVDPSTEFAIANSIWYREGFPVENYFLHVNREFFNAEVNESDFLNPETLNRINKWCADNTKNKIPQIIESIPDEAIMYLINAVYFKGIWKSQFDKENTSDAIFYKEDGTTWSVKMMRQKAFFNYWEDQTARYLTLPYGNGAFSMKIILPNYDKNVDDVINNLNKESWSLSSGSPANNVPVEVNLQLPSFKAECEYQLQKEVLPTMGMQLPFSDFADFTGISRGGGIKISQVIHKTYVSVGEEGTEAAAVTVVGMETTAGPPSNEIYYTVNRPFVFVIQENSTGTILFMGAIKEL